MFKTRKVTQNPPKRGKALNNGWQEPAVASRRLQGLFLQLWGCQNHIMTTKWKAINVKNLHFFLGPNVKQEKSWNVYVETTLFWSQFQFHYQLLGSLVSNLREVFFTQITNQHISLSIPTGERTPPALPLAGDHTDRASALERSKTWRKEI